MERLKEYSVFGSLDIEIEKLAGRRKESSYRTFRRKMMCFAGLGGQKSRRNSLG